MTGHQLNTIKDIKTALNIIELMDPPLWLGRSTLHMGELRKLRRAFS